MVVVVLWSVLGPGPDFATTSVTLPPSTSLAPLPELLLRADGIGSIDFGVSPDEVHAVLSEQLGPPVEDTNQPCVEDGEPGRWVRWGNLTTISHELAFRAYVYGIYYPQDAAPIAARTDDGLGLGLTAAEAIEIFGDRFEFLDPGLTFEEGEVWAFGIDGYQFEQSTEGIGGYIEGDQEAGQVVTIVGGHLCPSLGRAS
jgi:hypothetical protein